MMLGDQLRPGLFIDHVKQQKVKINCAPALAQLCAWSNQLPETTLTFMDSRGNNEHNYLLLQGDTEEHPTLC